MEDRRRQSRLRTDDYFKHKKNLLTRFFGVIDRIDDHPVGNMIDVSSGGMMIISREPLNDGTVLKLQIRLPEKVNGKDRISVDARSVWCRQDINRDFYYIGFEFLTISPNHSGIIEELIRMYSMPESPQQDPTKTG
jgi:hypothetical protein